MLTYYPANEDQMAYFFVVGSARSGGTLVYAILCSDPAMNPVLHENHFVEMAASAYATSRNRLQLEKGHFFADPQETQEFFTCWITSFLEKVRSRYAPARHLAIKSIALGARCPELHEVVPSARFVMSVRDPRDIVASMIEVGKQQEKMIGRNQYPRDVERLASQVMACYRPCLACRDPGFRERLLNVKYEHLVNDPSSVIADIQSWAGLDLSEFDPAEAWPRSLRDFELYKAMGAPFAAELFGKAITPKPIGRYKSTLSAKEIATVERICAPLMNTFNYPPSEWN